MRWAPARERFWTHVNKTDDCWLWTGAVNGGRGYGCFYDGGPVYAHRFSWVLHFGAIPSGLLVLHRCDVRRCVRPDHLWLGTSADNSQDMGEKGRHPGPSLRGSAHGEAKLTEDQVREIRTSPETGRALAARFGVHESLVSLVRRRKAWTHI